MSPEHLQSQKEKSSSKKITQSIEIPEDHRLQTWLQNVLNFQGVDSTPYIHGRKYMGKTEIL